MNLLGKIFKNKAKRSPNRTSDALQKLRETEEILSKKQEYLENKILQELQLAKKNSSSNKRAALQALKRKKRYEKQLTQIDGTLTAVEMQRELLEGAKTNTTVVETMQSAADALNTAHKTINVEKVYDLIDDLADQQELSNEVMEAFSKPVGFSTDLDESELEKELEELEQQALDEHILEVPILPTTPVVPPEVVPEAKPAKEAHEDDLKELEAWAS